MSRILQAQHDCFPLSRPFRIARGTKTAADVVTVTIHDGDAFGRGEAVPYPRYGETIDGSLAAIEQVRPLIERGAGRIELLDILPAGAARNAIDCALLDLEVQRSRQDVTAMFGGPALRTIPSAMTVVIDTPEAMALDAARMADAPVLKIKVDANDPEAQIRAVRDAAPNAELIVDPNESWDRTVLEAMQRMMVEARVGLLEQPVPAGEDEWLEGITPEIPICADESVHVAADLAVVARRYQAVNVKLDKAGGFTAALKLAQAARARGLGLMTGCMVSSSLSIAPALHIALLSDFVDLDGPIWLREDRPGGIRAEGGFIHPPAAGFWGTPRV
ncbi:N-acetyl-D-Glu racemase DgcA [Sphingosinicella sp. LY1275]|uniref:N-acetyl-D-Glu racemase DgcA n=1 Tax=Sphingosinicella sp. LY1275 TaxID=3095379 RepID=UPI002ADEC28F|nr:N-acetyl-D-Glu racemase DgcA [Sphingosinicella sp. LY1275]MEA1015992.1 N-acetyl-D-Glu racemase DgcA [Sphingosinicella sp. LY1275]